MTAAERATQPDPRFDTYSRLCAVRALIVREIRRGALADVPALLRIEAQLMGALR